LGVTDKSGGLHDCTVPQTEADVPELRPSIGSLAESLYGRPYRDLTRREQRQLDNWVKGHRQELEAQIRSISRNNLLSAQQRVERLGDAQEKLIALFDSALTDSMNFYYNGDNMSVTEHSDYMKNASGTTKRKVLNLKTLAFVNKAIVETQATLIKAQKEAQPTTFVKNEDNRTVVLTPEDIKARLGNLQGGQIVDQSGDGSDSEQGDND